MLRGTLGMVRYAISWIKKEQLPYLPGWIKGNHANTLIKAATLIFDI